MMRKVLVMLVTALALAVAGVALGEVRNGRLLLKAGDKIYACGCGKGCPCDTLSRKEGKCGCGNKLVEAKVVKVDDGTAVLSVKGENVTFKTVGKFQCACGASCSCDTISQKPGKCGCGSDLVAVAKK